VLEQPTVQQQERVLQMVLHLALPQGQQNVVLRQLELR
jgi:hypothetical protein